MNFTRDWAPEYSIQSEPREARGKFTRERTNHAQSKARSWMGSRPDSPRRVKIEITASRVKNEKRRPRETHARARNSCAEQNNAADSGAHFPKEPTPNTLFPLLPLSTPLTHTTSLELTHLTHKVLPLSLSLSLSLSHQPHPRTPVNLTPTHTSLLPHQVPHAHLIPHTSSHPHLSAA